jgi:hypothetical protein
MQIYKKRKTVSFLAYCNELTLLKPLSINKLLNSLCY